jgi:hypothetical protein
MSKVIIAIWSDGRVECYSTLTVFLEHNPGRNYETISYHISRNNRPYSDGEVTLHRCTVTRAAGGLKTKTLKKVKSKKGQ